METRKVNGTGKKKTVPGPTITVTETNGQVIGQPSVSPSTPIASPTPAPTIVANETVAPAVAVAKQ